MEKAPKKRGRPEGSTSKLARDAIQRAKESGELLPHEILLSMARGEPQKEYKPDPVTGKVAERWVSMDIEQRRDAAKAAAPYFAPKISTVEVIHGISDDNLDAIIAQLAAETGLALGAGGEAEEAESSEAARAEPGRTVRVKLNRD